MASDESRIYGIVELRSAAECAKFVGDMLQLGYNNVSFKREPPAFTSTRCQPPTSSVSAPAPVVLGLRAVATTSESVPIAAQLLTDGQYPAGCSAWAEDTASFSEGTPVGGGSGMSDVDIVVNDVSCRQSSAALVAEQRQDRVEVVESSSGMIAKMEPTMTDSSVLNGIEYDEDDYDDSRDFVGRLRAVIDDTSPFFGGTETESSTSSRKRVSRSGRKSTNEPSGKRSKTEQFFGQPLEGADSAEHRFTCLMCSVEFRLAGNSTLCALFHKRLQHSTSHCRPRFECSLCTYKTPWKKAVRLHLRRHHQGTSGSEFGDTVNPALKREWVARFQQCFPDDVKQFRTYLARHLPH